MVTLTILVFVMAVLLPFLVWRLSLQHAREMDALVASHREDVRFMRAKHERCLAKLEHDVPRLRSMLEKADLERDAALKTLARVRWERASDSNMTTTVAKRMVRLVDHLRKVNGQDPVDWSKPR
jgi:hypothetical protein